MMDREGFDGFSSRKLAAELSIAPLTLYNYYADINALVMRRLRYPVDFAEERLQGLCREAYARILAPDEPYFDSWDGERNGQRTIS